MADPAVAAAAAQSAGPGVAAMVGGEASAIAAVAAPAA